MTLFDAILDDIDGVEPGNVIEDEATREQISDSIQQTADIPDEQVPAPEPPTTFDLPSFGEEQFDLLTSVDLTQGSPETGETESEFGIELEAEDNESEPLDAEEVNFDVTVTDHLGTDPFNDAPNDALEGSTTVEFTGGGGSFTIGGADRDGADLTLGFFGFLPEVNDVESIDIDAPDDVEIINRTLELNPDTGESAMTADISGASEDGFAETIEERE